MISNEELQRYINDERGGKNLTWVNYFKPIPDTNSTGVNEQRKYKGQWKKDQKTWEGIGTIIFPDGSTYQGMTKSGQFSGKGRMTHANSDIY
mgnify:CR=1 FL=1|jgi:hypothetical protein